MSPKQKRWRNRIIVAIVLFVIIYALELSGVLDRAFGDQYAVYAEFALFLIPYLIGGYDVIAEAFGKLAHGHGLDESFLMTIATFGAFALVFFPDSQPHMAEGAAVMLFYQVGELFQSYAVGKSRKSITDMMDIMPEIANVVRDGELVEVSPYDVAIGDIVVVKPGERVPIDGDVVAGESQLDTSALTGESRPRTARPGDEVISGCVNISGTIELKATTAYENSTVSRILELVENASEKKARTENFITRFARYYTPIVVGLAAAIAIIPSLVLMLSGADAGIWQDWIFRGLTFLVVSCPCALVISIPLTFFGSIGGASKMGILVKGSNYLELLAKVDTVVFDKTGTLTSGTFSVREIVPAKGYTEERLLELAAHAEVLSNHPIAVSVRDAYDGAIDFTRVSDMKEIGGQGISSLIDGQVVLAGNEKLMYLHDIDYETHEFIGTQVHIAVDGTYAGTIYVGDTIKADSAEAIRRLREVGVTKTVMLTGDVEDVARAVCEELGVDEYRAGLLPANKVEALEGIMEAAGATSPDTDEKQAEDRTSRVTFVGDGINDAPVLMRADVGIAMGAMGSDAAIEAADIVLMDDKPSGIYKALCLAKRTMRIVWQNIVFALGIKFAVLVLAALGIANMWMAVFADVGVAIIAILNAMRTMRINRF